MLYIVFRGSLGQGGKYEANRIIVKVSKKDAGPGHDWKSILFMVDGFFSLVSFLCDAERTYYC